LSSAFVGFSVYNISAFLHPYAGWRFELGAGEKRRHNSGGKMASLRRVGVGYDFQVGLFVLTPMYKSDRVDGRSSDVVGVMITGSF